jgi:hypothetical protein
VRRPGRRTGQRGDAARAPTQMPRPARAARCRPTADRDWPTSDKSIHRPGSQSLSAAYSELAVGLRWHIAFLTLGELGHSPAHPQRREAHHARPRSTPPTGFPRRVSRSVSRSVASARRSPGSAPTGTLGPAAPRISHLIQRRGRLRRGSPPQLGSPLATALGARGLLFGRSRRAGAEARFFPPANTPSLRPLRVRPSPRRSCP